MVSVHIRALTNEQIGAYSTCTYNPSYEFPLHFSVGDINWNHFVFVVWVAKGLRQQQITTCSVQ